MMISPQFMPCCVLMLLVLSNTSHSYRLWHLNKLTNGLKNAGYHSLDLRPSFNSWGGETSGISIFLSEPRLTTPKGYYVPSQNGNVLRHGTMKRGQFDIYSRKRAPFNSWAGKRNIFDSITRST